MKYLVINATFSPDEDSAKDIATANEVLKAIPDSLFFGSYAAALEAVAKGIPGVEAILTSFTPRGLLSPQDLHLIPRAFPDGTYSREEEKFVGLSGYFLNYGVAISAINVFAKQTTGRRLVVYSGASPGRALQNTIDAQLSGCYPRYVWLKKTHPEQDFDRIIAALAGDPLVESDD